MTKSPKLPAMTGRCRIELPEAAKAADRALKRQRNRVLARSRLCHWGCGEAGSGGLADLSHTCCAYGRPDRGQIV